MVLHGIAWYCRVLQGIVVFIYVTKRPRDVLSGNLSCKNDYIYVIHVSRVMCYVFNMCIHKLQLRTGVT